MRARLLLVLLATVLGGCSTVPPRTDPLVVVATVAPLGEWVREIGKERVDVGVVVPPGVDPQSYAPSEKQRQQIKTADLVILNGLGLEPWIDDALAGGRSDQIVVELAQFVAPPSAPAAVPTPTSPAAIEVPDATPTPVGAQRSAASQPTSPYLWLDPRTAMQQVDMIARALTRADAAGFRVYRQNAARYAGDIENIDSRIERQVEAWPDTTVRATDGFLLPFTVRYGLTLQVVDDEPNAATEGPLFVNRLALSRAGAAPPPADAVPLDPLGGSTYGEIVQTLALSMTNALNRPTRGSSD